MTHMFTFPLPHLCLVCDAAKLVQGCEVPLGLSYLDRPMYELDTLFHSVYIY